MVRFWGMWYVNHQNEVRTYEDRMELEVGKGNIGEFLETCLKMGLEPHTIEPKRLDLEDFFMGFISE